MFGVTRPAVTAVWVAVANLDGQAQEVGQGVAVCDPAGVSAADPVRERGIVGVLGPPRLVPRVARCGRAVEVRLRQAVRGDPIPLDLLGLGGGFSDGPTQLHDRQVARGSGGGICPISRLCTGMVTGLFTKDSDLGSAEGVPRRCGRLRDLLRRGTISSPFPQLDQALPALPSPAAAALR